MGRRIAFLVGNQTFEPESGFAPLRGPLNDIDALSRIFGDPTLGAFEVRTLPDANSGDIKAGIEEELGKTGPGDLVLIHYAGHGRVDRAGNLCLATRDSRSSALYATSIPANHIRDLVNNSYCEAVIMLLDCCYSGVATRGLRGDVNSQLKSLQNASGFYILSASSEIQTAEEVDSTNYGDTMGRFTASVVDGIQTGVADYDKDGNITLYDIVRYVTSAVRHQTPQFLADRGSGDPLISRSPIVTAPILVAVPVARSSQQETSKETSTLAVASSGADVVAAAHSWPLTIANACNEICGNKILTRPYIPDKIKRRLMKSMNIPGSEEIIGVYDFSERSNLIDKALYSIDIGWSGLAICDDGVHCLWYGRYKGFLSWRSLPAKMLNKSYHSVQVNVLDFNDGSILSCFPIYDDDVWKLLAYIPKKARPLMDNDPNFPDHRIKR